MSAKYLMIDCDFCGGWRSGSHIVLTGVKEFIFIHSTSVV